MNLKTIILFIIITLSSQTFCQAQQNKLDKNLLATTIDEYNYATRGYAYQIRMGLTTSKEGYELKHLHTYRTPQNLSQGKKLTVDYIGMYRTNTEIPCSIIAIANRSSTVPQYICIPHPHTAGQVKTNCDNTIMSLSESRLRLYFFGLQDLYTRGNIKKFMAGKRKDALKEIGWSQEFKDEFVKFCKNGVVPDLQLNEQDPDILCYCVLGKIMKKYTTPAETKGIKSEVVEIAKECAK